MAELEPRNFLQPCLLLLLMEQPDHGYDLAVRLRPMHDGEGDPGILAASGLVAGEGLAGVLVAALVALGVAPKTLPPRLGGVPGELAAAAVLLLLCYFLWRAARRHA